MLRSEGGPAEEASGAAKFAISECPTLLSPLSPVFSQVLSGPTSRGLGSGQRWRQRAPPLQASDLTLRDPA